jgi:hypothetical protein
MRDAQAAFAFHCVFLVGPESVVPRVAMIGRKRGCSSEHDPSPKVIPGAWVSSGKVVQLV